MKKLYYLIVIVAILGLVLTGCSLLSNVGQVPATEQSGVTYLMKSDVDNPYKIDLLAGQIDDIGDVLVWNDAENLYVKFVYEGSECGFLEVHLQVDKDSFSQDILNKKGNPIPGQFENSYDVGCFTEKLFTYDLAAEGFECGDVLKIAAHAVVPSGEVNADSLDGPAYATNVFNVTPGTGSVRDPSTTLGAPDSEYNVANFYSLGFEGCIELEFEDFVGGTLTVYEVTWQHPTNFTKYPLESADISVSADGANWTYLGKADNSGQSSSNLPIPNVFTLEECIKYVRICDTTDSSLFGSGANAFDLDAIEAEYYCEKETAWGAGTRFVDKGNWATYFTYDLQGVKVGLIPCPYNYPDPSNPPPGEVFVIFCNLLGTGYNFEMIVSMIDVEPLTEYDIHLSVTESGGWSANKVGTLRSDGSGNAIFYMNDSLTPGSHTLGVVITLKGSGADIYETLGVHPPYLGDPIMIFY